MGFPISSNASPHSLLTYTLDTIDEDSVGSTIPAFPRSKPTPVTDSPPILVTTSDRIIDTPSTVTPNWTTKTANNPSTLPTGTRTHTTMIHEMNPAHSIRLRGTIPIVTIMDNNPDDPSDLEPPTKFYPSPNEPNYYVPLLEPTPPSTLAESITHPLLDSIIRDTVAHDIQPRNNNNQQTDPPHTAQYSTNAQSTTTQLLSSHPDLNGNTADDNNDQPMPPSNANNRDDHTDDRAGRNDNNEQPTKRTKTTTAPIDDIQEFSLRIPTERSVTDTVYQITAQMFQKLLHDDTLQFIHSNNTTVPAPAPFDNISDFPVRALDFSSFFHGITITTRNQRDRTDGTKVIVRIRSTITATELKRRIFPHLQALDTHMDSKAIWSHGMTPIGWIHSAHTNYCYRNYYATEITAGFTRTFYDPIDARHSLEQDRVTNDQRTTFLETCPKLPHIAVKPFTIRTEFNGNQIAAEVLAIFAPNPFKAVMREAFSCLNPSLLGIEKCLISFDYEQHIGPNKFAQMLIHNNVLHNQSTAIPIYNVHPDVLNQTYNDPDYKDMEENWCLHQSLLEHGLCSIETTKDTATLGKYLCVVHNDKHDRLLRQIQLTFESFMDRIGDGHLDDKCLAQYGNTPTAGRDPRPKDMDSARAATVMQCLQQTELRHGLPDINNITDACLVMNTENNTTQRRTPKPRKSRTFAFDNIADVSCAPTAIPHSISTAQTPTVGFPHQPRDSTAPAAPSYSTMARVQDAKSVQSAISSTASPSKTVATDISALSTVVTQMSAMISTMNESMRQDRIDQRTERLADLQNQQQFQHNQQHTQQQFFVDLLKHLNVTATTQPQAPSNYPPHDNQTSPPSDGMNHP